MVWISIEGSIGSGKTTVIDKLNDEYSNHNVGIYKEPIEVWKPCLNLFYYDQKRFSFLMQIRANTSFINIYNSIQNKQTAITERSSFSSQHVFGKLLNDKGNMSNQEYKLSNELVRITQLKIPDYFIYLRTRPNVSYNRIIERGDRPININYLKDLSNYHDRVFINPKGINVYVIDTTNLSKSDTFNQVVDIIRIIKLNRNKNL